MPMKDAVTVAHINMEKRLDGMNEFRDSLRDQNMSFVRKEEYDSGHRRLLDDMKKVELNFVSQDKFDAIIGRSSEDIKSLELTRAELVGKASQSSVLWAAGIAVLSIVISLIGLINNFMK